MGQAANRVSKGNAAKLSPVQWHKAGSSKRRSIAMTTATLTGTDLRLRNFVVRELDWDPDVDASAIGVSAQNGVVTLTGFVDTYAGTLAAERVAKRVRGVRAVANDLTVRLTVERTDADIAADAAAALKVQTTVADKI